MIQDKIFFDEKDPTGVSYNTPFTVYGSYEGRLWSKTPTGSIKYYTQNSDLSVYATTGSNQFSGSQTVTGSLTVTGGITGSVTTASYVEYTGVANKPALVSGSSQVTYSGLTGVPAGIVSSSAQVGGYGVFATTGSNQFNGSQSITGSLTVTGQVVAQTLNVQQVTSSIVYSSGSNVFGNSVSNTQQFTGSLQVSGSSHYVLGNVGISTITPQTPLQILRDTTGNGTSIEESNMAFTVLSAAGQSKISIGTSNAGNYGYVQVMQDATSWTNRNLVLQPRGGNVGIGTYSPLSFANTLTVHMNGGSNGSFFTMAGSGTRYLTILAQSGEGKIETNTAIPLILATNEVERMRITSGGNVVMGNNAGSAWSTSSTRTTLEIYGGAYPMALHNSNSVGNSISYNTYWDGTNWRYVGAAGSVIYIQDSEGHKFFHNGSGSAGASFTPAERMRITSGGNVGIGTTPDVKFQVNDGTNINLGIKVGQTNTSAVMLNAFNNGATANIPLEFRASSYNFTVGAATFTSNVNVQGEGTYLGIDAQATPRLGFVKLSGAQPFLAFAADPFTIKVSSGSTIATSNTFATALTIATSGAATFANTLTVANGITVSSNAFGNYFGKFGAASTSLLELREFTGDQTATTLILRSSRSDTFYHMQAFNNSSTECFRIESNGNVKNTNSSYGSLSDIKIKENIVDATPKLDDLLKVRIRNYNIIGQDVKQIGVIAQELEEIFPSMVDENQDRDNDGNLLETTTKGVKYSVFVPILIKSIQEQQTQIESLKSENDALKEILQRNNIS